MGDENNGLGFRPPHDYTYPYTLGQWGVPVRNKVEPQPFFLAAKERRGTNEVSVSKKNVSSKLENRMGHLRVMSYSRVRDGEDGG